MEKPQDWWWTADEYGMFSLPNGERIGPGVSLSTHIRTTKVLYDKIHEISSKLDEVRQQLDKPIAKTTQENDTTSGRP